MRTKKQVLVTCQADGTVEIVPMRYNASHQRGWRCYIGALANDPVMIGEETPPSFQGRSPFDALAVYRATIEPLGGRLLHAIASGECWPDIGKYDRFCRRLTFGSQATELIDGFLPIGPEEAVTLEEQRARYEAWRASLPTNTDTQNMPASRAKRALETVNAVIIAKREANILSRGDLQSGDGDGG
jgi:hypothetical protein